MADYDAGEVTERERLAANRLTDIANANVAALRNQLSRQLDNYGMANQQNAALADVQVKQNQRKTEADRFEANRGLQNAALSLLQNGMTGSTVPIFMRMLEDRNDADNQTYWTQYQTNVDAVRNAQQESENANNVASMDAVINGAKAASDIGNDLAANLNNINPNLYQTGEQALGNASDAIYEQYKKNPALARLSGYIMPETAQQTALNMTPRNRLLGNDYFSRLVNNANGR